MSPNNFGVFKQLEWIQANGSLSTELDQLLMKFGQIFLLHDVIYILLDKLRKFRQNRKKKSFQTDVEYKVINFLSYNTGTVLLKHS